MKNLDQIVIVKYLMKKLNIPSSWYETVHHEFNKTPHAAILAGKGDDVIDWLERLSVAKPYYDFNKIIKDDENV